MENVILKGFASHVKKMMAQQREYFQLIAKARKSRSPEDFKAAQDALKLSKEREAKVASMTHDILGEEVPNA